jgi:hypothetical protein
LVQNSAITSLEKEQPNFMREMMTPKLRYTKMAAHMDHTTHHRRTTVFQKVIAFRHGVSLLLRHCRVHVSPWTKKASTPPKNSNEQQMTGHRFTTTHTNGEIQHIIIMLKST